MMNADVNNCIVAFAVAVSTTTAVTAAAAVGRW